jgi:hypothetical protein
MTPMQRPDRRPAAGVRPAALVAVALALGGCTPDKPAALATCERETMRFYSGSAGDDFTVACMEAKGYRFDVLPEDCDSKTRMARQPACYVPVGWLAAFLDRLGRPSNASSTAQSKAGAKAD